MQDLVFEEIPRARMLVYPNDWDASTHWIHTVDDSYNSLVSFSGNWTQQVDPRLITYPSGMSGLQTPFPQLQIDGVTKVVGGIGEWYFYAGSCNATGSFTVTNPDGTTATGTLGGGRAYGFYGGTRRWLRRRSALPTAEMRAIPPPP